MKPISIICCFLYQEARIMRGQSRENYSSFKQIIKSVISEYFEWFIVHGKSPYHTKKEQELEKLCRPNIPEYLP